MSKELTKEQLERKVKDLQLSYYARNKQFEKVRDLNIEYRERIELLELNLHRLTNELGDKLGLLYEYTLKYGDL